MLRFDPTSPHGSSGHQIPLRYFSQNQAARDSEIQALRDAKAFLAGKASGAALDCFPRAPGLRGPSFFGQKEKNKRKRKTWVPHAFVACRC